MFGNLAKPSKKSTCDYPCRLLRGPAPKSDDLLSKQQYHKSSNIVLSQCRVDAHSNTMRHWGRVRNEYNEVKIEMTHWEQCRLLRILKLKKIITEKLWKKKANIFDYNVTD